MHSAQPYEATVYSALQGPPGGMMKQVDPQTGKVTNYAVYDANGNIVRRVDLTGASHANVPTPHVIDYQHNTGPDGTVYPREDNSSIRSANPEEIP